MLTDRLFVACKQRVHNRGAAPDAFLNELVDWGQNAPEEIFEKNDKFDVYSSVIQELGPWTGAPHRRATMLEVLRVPVASRAVGLERVLRELIRTQTPPALKRLGFSNVQTDEFQSESETAPSSRRRWQLRVVHQDHKDEPSVCHRILRTPPLHDEASWPIKKAHQPMAQT